MSKLTTPSLVLRTKMPLSASEAPKPDAEWRAKDQSRRPERKYENQSSPFNVKTRAYTQNMLHEQKEAVHRWTSSLTGQADYMTI